MIAVLIAGALAEASATATGVALVEDMPPSAVTEVHVEAPRGPRRWQMPKLDYGTSQGCTSWWEGELPGFGTISFGPPCTDRDSDASSK